MQLLEHPINPQPLARARRVWAVTVCGVTPFVLVDMASCTFRRSPDGRSVALLGHSGELLAVVDAMPNKSTKAIACEAFDTALASGRVSRDGTLCNIALYNPATFEVAVGPLPDTVAVTDGERIGIPPRGLRCNVRADGTLHVGDRVLGVRRYESFAQLSRAHAAHTAPI